MGSTVSQIERKEDIKLSGQESDNVVHGNITTESPWSNMIDDVLRKIVIFLPISSLSRFSLVCKHWNSIFSLDALWNDLYVSYGWPIGPFVKSLLQTDPDCSWREIFKKTHQITSYTQILSVTQHLDEVWKCTWDKKGQFFITNGKEGLVVKWVVQYDEENGIPKHVTRFPLVNVNQEITGLDLHPSGDYLTFNTNDDCVQLIETNHKTQDIPSTTRSSPSGTYGVWLSDSTFLVSRQKRLGNQLTQKLIAYHKNDFDNQMSGSILVTLRLRKWVQTPGIVGPEKLLVMISGKYGTVDQLCFSKMGINSIPPSSQIIKKKDFFDVYTMPGEIIGWTQSPDQNYILFNLCKYENENYLEILKQNDTPNFSSILDLCLFNITTRQIDRIYSGHLASVQQFLVWPAFGWKNLFFLSGSDDGKIYIYHRDLEIPFQIIDAHKKHVNQIIIHPTKDILISVSDDCKTKMWVPRFMARGKITSSQEN